MVEKSVISKKFVIATLIEMPCCHNRNDHEFMSLLPKLQSTKLQQIDFFARSKRLQSSPILGHPPNSLLTRGRRFQSSPIWRVSPSVGNTDSYNFDPCTL